MGRAVLATLVLSAGTLAVARMFVTAVRAAAAPGAGVDDLVAAAALGIGAAAGAWLVLGALLVALASAVRTVGRASAVLERTARAVAPGTLRRLLTAGVAAGLGLGLAGPAMADAPPDLGWQVTEPSGAATPATTAAPSPPPTTSPSAPPSATDPSPPTADPAEPSAPAPSPRPTAPTGQAAPASGTPAPATGGGTPSPSPAASPGPGDVDPGETPVGAPVVPTPGPVATAAGTPGAGPQSTDGVVVAAGDTLWDIAAAHLPPGASAADIAAAWPLWYEANRAVVGADPDLLQPGQRLTMPTEATP